MYTHPEAYRLGDVSVEDTSGSQQGLERVRAS